MANTYTIPVYKTRLEPKMAIELEREIPSTIRRIRDSRDIRDIMTSPEIQIHKESVECVWLLTMDTRNHPLGLFLISRGAIDKSFIPTREVIAGTILSGGTTCAICHNHPTGNPTASSIDTNMTRNLIQAMRLCGLELRDHVVIGNTFGDEIPMHYSFYDQKPSLWDSTAEEQDA